MTQKFKKDVEFKFAEKLPKEFYTHGFDYRILTSILYRNDVKMMYVWYQMMHVQQSRFERIKLYYLFLKSYFSVTKTFLTFEKKENRTNEMFNIWLDIVVENIIGIEKEKVIKYYSYAGKYPFTEVKLVKFDITLFHVSKIYYVVKGFFNILFI